MSHRALAQCLIVLLHKGKIISEILLRQIFRDTLRRLLRYEEDSIVFLWIESDCVFDLSSIVKWNSLIKSLKIPPHAFHHQ